MEFPFQIDIIELIIKGLVIGIIASAPMGPVGLLCIQRTINKGRWYGFVTGVGAALSDFFYALVTGLGMSFVIDLISDPTVMYWLKICGSVILLFFGIYSFRNDPTKHMRESSSKRGSYWYNGFTAFWITFLNPLIVFLFMAAFAQLSFIVPDHPAMMGVGFASIIVGALLWWFMLTWLIDNVRQRFDYSIVVMFNKILGSAVVIVSLVILFGTIFNLYSFTYY